MTMHTKLNGILVDGPKYSRIRAAPWMIMEMIPVLRLPSFSQTFGANGITIVPTAICIIINTEISA